MKTEEIQKLRKSLRALGMTENEIKVMIARKQKLGTSSTYRISSTNNPYSK